MSGTVPPIPPPLGTTTGSPSTSSPNRVDTIHTDNTNTTTTNNVGQNVVDENLPQLLDSRGALRLKFNAFKALEGEKVNGTFSRLKCLLNDLENNGITIPQAEVNATFVNSLPRKWLSMYQNQRANNSIKNDCLATCMASTTMKKGSDSDVEEDLMSNSEFIVNLNVEYHEKALLTNQKRFYKRPGRVGSIRKPVDKSNEICFACGKQGHFQKEFKYKGLKSEIEVLTKKIDVMSKRKSEKGLVVESFEWHEESMSFDDEGVTKVKAFMAIDEDEPVVGKGDARSGQWVEITMKKVQRLLSITSDEERKHVLDYTYVVIHYVEDQMKNLLSKFNSLNQELSLLLFSKATESPSETVLELISDSESECDNQEPLPPLPKLLGAEPSDTSNDVISLDDLTLTPTVFEEIKKVLDKRSAVKVIKKKAQPVTSSVPDLSLIKKTDLSTEKLLLTFMEEVKGLKEQSRYLQIPLHLSLNQEVLNQTRQAKDLDYLKRSVWYLDSGYSRHMTGVKQYLHIYSKESGPKVVFRDNSLGDIEGYGSVNCNGISFTRVAYGTIFNQNNEVVLIAPRKRDVYVIDMSSYNEESNACFFAKASNSVNWLWHKRLSHLNFKNINKLARQNLVAGLLSLTFSKDKTCSACEKGKHHRASFKTKRSFSISKYLHLLHMDLFEPVKPQTISHNKYTLVIVDEYSRYTWVFCLKKKSDAADCIMSFIRKMENLNEVRVKELRSDNGTEFRNYKLEEFCDEKGISQNFSSPCTSEQNGVAERRNRTLIEAARTMLNSANLPKYFWGEAVNTACYTQNRSIIVKRHGKTAYDVFKGRSPDISYFYVFGYLVHIHNHRDNLGKFDAKVDDGFFLVKMMKLFPNQAQKVMISTSKKIDHSLMMNSLYQETLCLNALGMIVISYVPAYDPLSTNNITIPDPITPFDPITLTDPITSSEPIFTSNESLDFIVADNHHVLNEHDDSESVEDLGDDVDQVSLISEPISEDEPSTINVSSSAEVFSNPPVPQDRWSREKHIELIDPKKLIEALEEEGWIIAMQEELNQFERNKVWTLVLIPHGKTIIGTKWIWKNKMDEHGVILKNKARLVAQGYNHAFLNGKISKEVYVQQPPGFESSKFPNHVCKLDKSLYGLKQAPRAWYQANPKESHLVAVKRIFRHLKGTPNLGLWYPKGSGFDLKSYSDSDYAGCNLDRKSTSGGCQILGGKLVCWNAKKQSTVVMSSAKAEYVAAAGCCAQVLSIKSELGDYDVFYDKVPVFCDNTSVIAISNNPVLHLGLNILTSAKPSFTRLVAELGMLNIEKEAPDKKNALSDALT
ncbi:retrovirus-related pol polyprotein from transposon TNT 1-94 [Tanacetum coccineum]